MANMVDLFKGGSPVVKYMSDEKDYVQFGGSFAENGFSDTPPYDSHVDGAYNVGNFCLGMPINPKIMAYQRKALTRHPLKVGDVLWLFWIPYDHFATYFNLKIRTGDASIAGLTLKPVAGKLTKSNSELAGKHFNANLVDEELKKVVVGNVHGCTSCSVDNIIEKCREKQDKICESRYFLRKCDKLTKKARARRERIFRVDKYMAAAYN